MRHGRSRRRDRRRGLLAACRRLWADLTDKRLYVTGGLGPGEHNEGFTTDYDLPNETAYAETCASVGLIFWAHRMLLLESDGRYADVMELALYNGALSGLSLDGERFFYDNPLASRGNHHRWTWHRCPCCPPNIARLIASLGSYVYSTAPGELAVHLYVESNARLEVDGAAVGLRQTTQLSVGGHRSSSPSIRRRPSSSPCACVFPAGAARRTLAVNGQTLDIEAITERGYACLRRRWQSGDKVKLALAMPVERLYAHPDVHADQGRVALKRGPIVYCLEAVDNAAPPHRLALPRDEAHRRPTSSPTFWAGSRP